MNNNENFYNAKSNEKPNKLLELFFQIEKIDNGDNKIAVDLGCGNRT